MSETKQKKARRSIAESESELWQGRITALKETGRTPLVFTYTELAQLWGVSKNGVYLKVNDWARDFPENVRLEHGDRPRAPVHIHFDFNPSRNEIVGEFLNNQPDMLTLIESENAEPVVPDVPSEDLEQIAWVETDIAYETAVPMPDLKEPLEALQTVSDALDSIGQTAVAVSKATDSMSVAAKVFEKEAKRLKELEMLERPDYISERAYTETVERLDKIGLEWESIAWERILWDSKKQSGRLQITLKSPDGDVEAIGIYQNGWLINNLAIQAR